MNNNRRSQRPYEYRDPPAGQTARSLSRLHQTDKQRDASEFCHGYGLVPHELTQAYPASGGKYRPISPPARPIPDCGEIIEHVWGNEHVRPPANYPRQRYEFDEIRNPVPQRLPIRRKKPPI